MIKDRLTTSSVIDAMNIINEEVPNPRIPLKFFVTKCLPILAGSKSGENQLNEWLNVSGSVYNQVDVIDESGNVIYTVPALMGRYITRTSIKGPTITAVSEQTQLKANILNSLGVKYFQNNIYGLLTEDKIDLSAVHSWNKILKENGYEVISTDIPTQEDNNQPNDNLVDVFDDDELEEL